MSQPLGPETLLLRDGGLWPREAGELVEAVKVLSTSPSISVILSMLFCIEVPHLAGVDPHFACESVI